MENETTPIDTNYQKGFNEGYLVTKHWPEMSDTIAQVKNLTPRLDGFRDGKRQFVLEKTREQKPKWLQADRAKTEKSDKSKEQDKDEK